MIQETQDEIISCQNKLLNESAGQRKKLVTLAWVALLVLPAVGLQILSRELIAGTPAAPQAGIGYGVDSTGDGDNVGSSQFCDDGTGHCTLRAAIQAANLHPGADFIGFVIPASDPGCDANGNCTIILPRALPNLSESVSITGPGANLLTVQRAFTAPTAFRIFNVTTTGTVNLSGLTISNGNSSDGGGISKSGLGTLNVTNSAISDNFADEGAQDGGGGIFVGLGTLNVTNSTIAGNTSHYGAGILCSNGTANVTNSTITGNNAGGGITALSFGPGGTSTVSIIRSTVSGNSGGGIVHETDSSTSTTILNVINSTISGNSGGSGIFYLFANGTSTVNITNSTISGNSATNNGGGISNQGGGGVTVTVKSSISCLEHGVLVRPGCFWYVQLPGIQSGRQNGRKHGLHRSHRPDGNECVAVRPEA